MSNTTLTKIQRHEVYKAALQSLLNEQCHFANTIGICNHLQSELFSLFKISSLYPIPYLFPEFELQRPFDTYLFWWHQSNYDIRIKVLEKCIEQTKPMFIETL